MLANRNAEISFAKSYWDDISEGCKNLISQMMALDPSNRISIKGLINSDVIILNPIPVPTKSCRPVQVKTKCTISSATQVNKQNS